MKRIVKPEDKIYIYTTCTGNIIISEYERSLAEQFCICCGEQTPLLYKGKAKDSDIKLIGGETIIGKPYGYDLLV